MKKLKVISIQIRDILGCREMAMEPGKVTVISGSNGSGKTSAIEAFKSIIGGGNLANIAYVAKEGESKSKPEIVLVCPD